jgi:hypothetical protein
MNYNYPRRDVSTMGMVAVPAEEAIAKNPKIVDFESINVYPSKYKIVNGEVILKSINIEDVAQQRQAIADLKTTVLIGDMLKLKFKFGHYTGGEWVDYYVDGIYKVKEIIPKSEKVEILIRISKVR